MNPKISRGQGYTASTPDNREAEETQALETQV